MKGVPYILVALAVATAALVGRGPADLVGRATTAHVVSVIDGDTVDVLIPPSRRVRVRLHGVDTPESGEPFSQQARRFTRSLVFSRDANVNGKDIDKYDRLVAQVVVDGAERSNHRRGSGLYIQATCRRCRA